MSGPCGATRYSRSCPSRAGRGSPTPCTRPRPRRRPRGRRSGCAGSCRARAARRRQHATRGGDRHRHPEQRERRADAGELGERRAEVRHEHRRHRERRPADREVLADQVEQPAPRREAEPGARLLRDEQGDHRREHHPEERVAELRADDRVRRDAARIVVGEAADDARAEHGEERELRDLDAGDPADAAREDTTPQAGHACTLPPGAAVSSRPCRRRIDA